MCSFPYLFRIVRIVCAWPTPWHTLLAALHAVRILHVAARDNIGCTCNLYLWFNYPTDIYFCIIH